MRRAKPQPIRNKIDLSDAAQTRAWTRRLDITPDDLKRMVGKVGNSIAAVSKEAKTPKPRVPVQVGPAAFPAVETVAADVQSTVTGS